LAEFEVLQATWDLIHGEYADPASIDDAALIYGAAEGMVDALGDEGHSRFLDPEAAEDFEEATRGEFTGVGIEIDFARNLPVVIAPIDGSPADEAGVRPGDTILAIDGQSTERLDQEDLADLIRGDAGTEVTLTLLHEGEDLPYDATMTRRTITLEPVSWRMLPDGVVHLRLAEFSAGAAEDLEAALRAARDRGATGVVLDLRNNPGGLVAEAVGVASQFMPEGTPIFRQQDRGQEAKPVNTVGTDGLWQEGPLAVLVNGGSASAAEIVGAALRDNGRAPLYGETTYGTGTVLIPFEQPDGSVVLLGTALWLTADGDQIWKQGVEPDPGRVVPLPSSAGLSRPGDDPEVTAAELAASPDRQLRAAFAGLTGTPLAVELPTPPLPR
ncbi:MAG: S41 family peptidase, partial [Chloroflexota bacterium]|nr:S41 family peptidase [Chloroflexota bacterium]